MSSLGPNEAEFARRLTRFTANDPSLTRVNFFGWGIGDEEGMRLVEALRGNTVVTHVWLKNNGISAPLVRALLEVLENSTSLVELDLSENYSLGVAVARFLRNNSSLVRLYMKDCGIGDEGARALAEALPSNSSLRRLVLGGNIIGNSIGDVGASLIAGALPGNSTLTVLRLEGNRIGDAGARALAEALPHNSSLEVLNLWWNYNISDVGAHLLAKALLVNSSVTLVYLRRNDISNAFRQLVDELERINAYAPSPHEALERKVKWLRNLDASGLGLLGFEESGLEEEILRLGIVCRVGWLIDSGVDVEKEEAVTLVLDQLEHFMQADQRRGLFRQLLGVRELGVDVASSVDETTARTLYRYAVQCGAAPGVLMNLVRAHGSLCTCRDVEHYLVPFMLLAATPEAGVGDVMELLLMNPSLVESGISGPNHN